MSLDERYAGSAEPRGPLEPPDPLESGSVLHRAVSTLRDEPDSGWEEASTRVRSALRRTTRRARRLEASTADLPVDAFAPDDHLAVSERVVVGGLRRAVSGTPGVAPVAVTLHVVTDGEGAHRCTGARLQLVVGFGVAVVELTGRLRPDVVRALTDLLGPTDWVVDLDVVDVEPGDPAL